MGRDRKNYAACKLVIGTAVEAESFSTNRKAGYLESKTKQLIVSSVSENVLHLLSRCKNSESLFDKLEMLYGTRLNDLDELYTVSKFCLQQ